MAAAGALASPSATARDGPGRENLARAALLGAAALALEAGTAERRGEPGATLMAGLAGLVFAAGVFTRGSMLALAIALAGALVLVRPQAPRSRRVLLWTLVVGTTLAAMQAIVWSWPYFFSAASNHFHVLRAEVVEGDMPRALVEWGGPWELHRIDPSIWRGHGAFSLHPGSRFVASVRPGELRTVPIELRWEAGARVELHVPRSALEGCTVAATLEGERAAVVSLPQVSEPRASVLAFALPEPRSEAITAAVVVRWTCAGAGADPLPWRRLSMRWDRR